MDEVSVMIIAGIVAVVFVIIMLALTREKDAEP